MSELSNAAIARRLLEEVWNKGNLEVVDELVDPDFVNFGQRRGSDAYKWIVGLWRTAFADLHYTVEDEIVEGDAVVHRVTCSGTHTGDFRHLMGVIPPTGQHFSVDQVHIQRFANRRLLEHWGTRNDLAMYQQLGVLPAPDPPATPISPSLGGVGTP